MSFFPLDFFLRRPDRPCPQEAADATGLTIICDEDAASVGADCWHGTQLGPAQARAAYEDIGGTVSAVYSPSWRQ